MLQRILIGAAAGVAATVPMTATMEVLHRTLPGEPPRPLPPREVAEGLAVKAGVNRHLDEIGIERLTLAVHVGYGAFVGAVYGAIAPRQPAAAIPAGLLYGMAVWSASYLGWLPAAGVRQPITYDPPDRTRTMIAAHLVFGASLALLTTGALALVGRGRRRRASSRDRARA